MTVLDDFKKFIFRGNVVDLAVGVVIGAAFGKIVTAIVEDLVMPVVGALLPGGTWRDYVVEPAEGVKFRIGHLVGQMLDFLIVAAVLFFVLVRIANTFKKQAPAAPAAPPAPPSKTCPECLETVAQAARRCKHCTAVLTEITAA